MKITKEMFWNLPQLARIEYMLIRKELKDRSQVGVTMSLAWYFILFFGYILLLSMIGYLINPDLFVKFIDILKSMTIAFTIVMCLGVVLDVYFIIIEYKKSKEINKRFFK